MAPSLKGLPLHPTVISVTPEEIQSKKWSRQNIQKIAECMHRDGLVAISGLVAPAHIDALSDSMTAEAKNIIKSGAVTYFNHGVATNFLQSPPLADPELLFEDVYANPLVQQAVETYLGPEAAMLFYTANTAIPHTKDRQPVHKDAAFNHPVAPYTVVVNFLLHPFTAETGSTEFWLGSHAETDVTEQLWASADAAAPSCAVAPQFLAERRATRPPVQVNIPKGTVLIRDVRTWHAGMPNPSDIERIMIGIGFRAGWLPCTRNFLAPESARPLLEKCYRPTNVDYWPDEKWKAVCQNWNTDGEMHLRFSPEEDPSYEGLTDEFKMRVIDTSNLTKVAY